jgi:acyl carrier protein
MKDLIGNTFQVGDTVARAKTFGSSPFLALEKVTAIKDGKVYLNDSNQHIRFLNRLVIITELRQQEPPKPVQEWPKSCTNDKMKRLLMALNDYVDHVDVTPDLRLANSPEFDSLDLVEIIMLVEDTFGVEIPDEDAEKVVFVKDILELPQLKEKCHE